MIIRIKTRIHFKSSIKERAVIILFNTVFDVHWKVRLLMQDYIQNFLSLYIS